MMGGDGKGGLSPVTKDIVEDVMPMIESTYKVSKRPDDRAIAGLSMGGGHSINISFVRPELFRYVALMSPAAGGGVAKMYPRIAEKPDILNKQFKLFWVGVGKDDTLTGSGRQGVCRGADGNRRQAHVRADAKAVTSGRSGGTISTTSRRCCSSNFAPVAVFELRWPSWTGTDRGLTSYQQRPRPERGAKSPRESERGWGPASTEYGVGSDLRSARQRLAQHAGRGVADPSPPRHARHPRVESPLGRARRARLRAPDLRRRLRHAGAHGRRDGGLRRGVRALPHRLDHPQRGLSLQPDRGDRPVRDRQAIGRAPVGRSARAGTAHRVLVRRVHRRAPPASARRSRSRRRSSWGWDSRRSTLPACRSSPTPRRWPMAPSARRSSRLAPSPASHRIC